ncbi:glucoside xylosyltransferase 1-like [Haliotis asinina]|uniref:glucoside xylosyltransferase 1-like n=1 Tax=Haliotis asinina TaxID=109174 RepID=UPI0035322059
MYRPSCRRCIMLLTALAIFNGLLWSILQGVFSQGSALSTLKILTRRRIGSGDKPIGLDLDGLQGIKKHIGNEDKPIGLDLSGLQGIKRRSNKPHAEATALSMLSAVDRAVAEKYLGQYERTPQFTFSGGQDTSGTKHQFVRPEGMHLALAMCGKRFEEVKVLVKSVLLFSRHVTFHVFSDTPSQQALCDHIKSLPIEYSKQFSFHIYNVTLPRGNDAKVWGNLYGPCAAQRLFIPYIIPNVTKLIYVDTDVIFLSPMENLWGQFNHFSKSHIAALIPEHEDPSYAWYNRVAKTPYYGKLGLNSGVMLMDLVRLREHHWLEKMMNYFRKYLPKLMLGDQDLINIFFHFEPEKLYQCSCEWNYRADHCQFPSTRSRCPPALKHGAYTLHGNSQRFHGSKYPALSAVYTAFQSHRLGLDTKTALLESIKTRLKGARSSCGSMPEAFYKKIEEHINLSSAVH